MPSMASITVKKFDGTTDIIFDAVSASGGDSSPAVWRQDTGAAASLPIGLRSQMKVWTQWNGPKTARQLKYQLVFPYATQDSTTTLYSARDRIQYEGICTLPQALPAVAMNEGAYQGFNLLGSLLMRQMAAACYAAT